MKKGCFFSQTPIYWAVLGVNSFKKMEKFIKLIRNSYFETNVLSADRYSQIWKDPDKTRHRAAIS